MKSQTNGRGCAACDAGPDHDRHSQSYWMPVASAVLFAAGLVMQYTGVEFFASSAVRFCWYLAAYFPVGLPVLREAWNGMRQRDFFTEYTLMHEKWNGKLETVSKTNGIMNDSNLGDGAVILMHDIHGPSVDAALRLIPDLIAQGYKLVTVSEMAAAKNVTLQPAKYAEFWQSALDAGYVPGYNGNGSSEDSSTDGTSDGSSDDSSNGDESDFSDGSGDGSDGSESDGYTDGSENSEGDFSSDSGE